VLVEIMAQTQGTLLEVLKKKMRAMKDELEAAKETTDDYHQRLQEEIRRREEVSLY
jgi:tropomyosin-1